MGLKETVTDALFSYETEKIVQVPSYKVGVIYRLIQLAIVLYVLIVVIIKDKGYQDKFPASGVSATKLKGIAYPRDVDNDNYKRVWDVADYVYPQNLESSFTVITNAVITPQQTPGTCPEDPEIGPLCDCEVESNCSDQCERGMMKRSGKCVASAVDPDTKVCEIQGWCPVEVDKLPNEGVLLDEAVNFTVFIRNTVEFTKFDFIKRNVLDPSTLHDCTYSEDNVFCPIFRIGSILDWADVKFEDIAVRGGIMGIYITWDCDLDQSWESCEPEYTFDREDDPESGGHNFRYANYYRQDGRQYRDLIKAYGIRFDIIINGTGRKFDIVVLVNNIAAGLALLAIASIVGDFLIMYVEENRTFYKHQKISVISEEIMEKATTMYGAIDESKKSESE
ncbi:P2X purinoceptor 5-like isoform X2 [Convolutriloba macropyga]|uniref:P2X purinoceptor 5-like isoform X2 n=1 Tax=Convolutriloba macropyga TaxID=536237 RepID=UPI003F520E1A